LNATFVRSILLTALPEFQVPAGELLSVIMQIWQNLVRNAATAELLSVIIQIRQTENEIPVFALFAILAYIDPRTMSELIAKKTIDDCWPVKSFPRYSERNPPAVNQSGGTGMALCCQTQTWYDSTACVTY